MKTFSNIYDGKGNAVILASEEPLTTLRRKAWYEHNLASPDYDVCQSEEAALAAAKKSNPKEEVKC